MEESEMDEFKPPIDTLNIPSGDPDELKPANNDSKDLVDRSDRLICMFCANAIPDPVNTELFHQTTSPSILHIFSKLFKISTKTLFQGTGYELTLKPFQCSSCSAMINDAVKILEAIEKLQVDLDVMTDILKCNLLKSYEYRMSLGGPCQENEKAVEFVQRTFIQCWSGCKVEVTQVKKKRRRGRPRKVQEEKVLEVEDNSADPGWSDAEVHVQMSPGEDSDFQTDIPGEREKVKKSFGKQRKRKNGMEFPFVCQTCGKGYYLQHYLNVHERSHEETVRPVKTHGMIKIKGPGEDLDNRKSRSGKIKRLGWFLCRHCQKKFDSQDFLTEDGKFKVFNGDLLPDTVESFTLFRKHHLAHCKEKPPEETHCDLCDKDFTSGKMLEDHRTVFHTKEFPFYCEKCGVGKISKSALNKHMLVHTNDKNFQCELCAQSFKRKVQLKFHMRRHNNEFPYLCETCGKRFVNLQLLQTHETIHLEEKRVPCPMCEKLFINKSYVRNHIYSFHRKSRKPKALSKGDDGHKAGLNFNIPEHPPEGGTSEDNTEMIDYKTLIRASTSQY